MAVGRFCRRPARAVRGRVSVRGAAREMEKERVGSLVIEDQGRPAGLVTDRDLVLAVLAEGRDPDETTVGELAGTMLVAVPEDLPVREAAAEMRRHGVRRVPVVDARGALVGIFAADDLLRLVAEELTALADVAAEQGPYGSEASLASVGRDAGHYVKEMATVSPDAPVCEVAERMRSAGVGSVIVVDAEGAPIGLITDRDLARRVLGAGRDPGATAVGDVMGSTPFTADANDGIREIARGMSEQGIRRVPILRDGRLVGIVTYDDLLVALGRELHDLGLAAQGAAARERVSWSSEAVQRDLERAVAELGAEIERLEEDARGALGQQLRALADRLQGLRA